MNDFYFICGSVIKSDVCDVINNYNYCMIFNIHIVRTTVVIITAKRIASGVLRHLWCRRTASSTPI